MGPLYSGTGFESLRCLLDLHSLPLFSLPYIIRSSAFGKSSTVLDEKLLGESREVYISYRRPWMVKLNLNKPTITIAAIAASLKAIFHQTLSLFCVAQRK